MCFKLEAKNVFSFPQGLHKQPTEQCLIAKDVAALLPTHPQHSVCTRTEDREALLTSQPVIPGKKDEAGY